MNFELINSIDCKRPDCLMGYLVRAEREGERRHCREDHLFNDRHQWLRCDDSNPEHLLQPDYSGFDTACVAGIGRCSPYLHGYVVADG